ncbi:NAD(P)H-binding protein [Nibrella saemangeumensis]|uniref:NAD(P)H-binding protein n=1 Tax=Nibrella saemangeumensis TaxID=1084526 RepID=A0ABP8MGD0_9BACT
MILIVGATGVLGHEAALQLLAAGRSVRAMVRNPEKAADLQQLGAEIVQGDLTDPASVAKACQGAEVVLAAAHSLMGRGKYRSENVDDAGHRTLIDAAKEAGVRHFIYTSIQGAGPDHPFDFDRIKYQIEQYLIHSGMTYTILRPSAFMELHAHTLMGKDILVKGKTTIFGQGNNPTNFVSVRDIARLITISLNDPKAHNRIIDIGGPTNPTKNEVANLYGRLAGVTPRIGHMSRGTLRVLSRVIRPFHPGIGRIMEMSAAMDEIDATMDMSETLKDFPLKLTTIEEFVQEQVANHKSPATSPSTASPVRG